MINIEPKSEEIEATLRLIAEARKTGVNPPSYDQFRQLREADADMVKSKLAELRNELQTHGQS